MRLSLSVIAFASMASLAGAAAAQPAPASIDATNVTESKAARAVDCGARNLVVSGSDDVLTVTNCAVINVVGNRNRLLIKLLPESSIAALGNDNHIIFEHAAAAEVQVSSTGTNNEIVPMMSAKDRQPNPPAKSVVTPPQ